MCVKYEKIFLALALKKAPNTESVKTGDVNAG